MLPSECQQHENASVKQFVYHDLLNYIIQETHFQPSLKNCFALSGSNWILCMSNLTEVLLHRLLQSIQVTEFPPNSLLMFWGNGNQINQCAPIIIYYLWLNWHNHNYDKNDMNTLEVYYSMCQGRWNVSKHTFCQWLGSFILDIGKSSFQYYQCLITICLAFVKINSSSTYQFVF